MLVFRKFMFLNEKWIFKNFNMTDTPGPSCCSLSSVTIKHLSIIAFAKEMSERLYQLQEDWLRGFLFWRVFSSAFIEKFCFLLGAVIQACNPSSWKVKVGYSRVQGHTWPCSSAEASMHCRRVCLKHSNKNSYW